MCDYRHWFMMRRSSHQFDLLAPAASNNSSDYTIQIPPNADLSLSSFSLFYFSLSSIDSMKTGKNPCLYIITRLFHIH